MIHINRRITYAGTDVIDFILQELKVSMPPSMPPPPLPEAFSDPAQDWGADTDPWNSVGDQNQNQAPTAQPVIFLPV